MEDLHGDVEDLHGDLEDLHEDEEKERRKRTSYIYVASLQENKGKNIGEPSSLPSSMKGQTHRTMTGVLNG